MTKYRCPYCGNDDYWGYKHNPVFETEKLEGDNSILDHMVTKHLLSFMTFQFEPDMSQMLDTPNWLNITEVKCKHCGEMVKVGSLLDHLEEKNHENDMFEIIKVK